MDYNFHENAVSFDGEVSIFLGFIKYNDPNHETMKKIIRKRYDLETLALEIKGGNKEGFKYQFCNPDEFGLIGLKLTFYSNTEAYVAFIPKGTKVPTNPGQELIIRKNRAIQLLNYKLAVTGLSKYR